MLHTIYLLTSRYYATTEWCGVQHGTAGALPGWSRAGGELQSGTRGGDPASAGCRLGLVDTVDTPCRYYTALTMSPPAACVMCRYICISMPSVAWCRYLLYLHTAAAVASAMNTGLALGWGQKGCADCGLETAAETIHTDTEQRGRRDSQLCCSRHRRFNLIHGVHDS